MSDYPPIKPGTKVRIFVDPAKQGKDWMPEALPHRRKEGTGVVKTHHDSHGLCYDVVHDDDKTEGCYDPHELFIDADIFLKTFRECIENVACFNPEDETFALQYEHSVLIGYNTNVKDPIASFNLQIDGRVCYILDLEVRADLRRNGIGRQLFYAIQKLCLRRGCTEIQTTPSGMGKLFWPVLGFEPMPPDFVGAIKHLKPIKDETEHQEALAHVEILLGAHDINPKFKHLFDAVASLSAKQVEDKLNQLVDLVVAYEEEWHPISKPTSEEAAQFRKEQEA